MVLAGCWRSPTVMLCRSFNLVKHGLLPIYLQSLKVKSCVNSFQRMCKKKILTSEAFFIGSWEQYLNYVGLGCWTKWYMPWVWVNTTDIRRRLSDLTNILSLKFSLQDLSLPTVFLSCRSITILSINFSEISYKKFVGIISYLFILHIFCLLFNKDLGRLWPLSFTVNVSHTQYGA